MLSYKTEAMHFSSERKILVFLLERISNEKNAISLIFHVNEMLFNEQNCLLRSKNI